MKLVINRCYGGFGLSEAAMMRYAELLGIKLYPEPSEYKFVPPTYWTVPPEKRPRVLTTEEFGRAPLAARAASNAAYRENTICVRDIPRDDANLVRVVEELGDKANGAHAKLAVVEIPDGIKWEIDEYDGMERVEEAHRSWA